MDPLKLTSIVPIADPSQLSVARRIGADYAQAAGLDEQRTSALNVVLAELANNLLQHAGGGHLYIGYLPSVGALDVAAVDHGQGMVNIDRCLTDGFSTGSTPGLGLGAVRRFAVRFGAYSLPNRTTVVFARMAERKPSPQISAVCSAIEGETVSGDAWDLSDDGRNYLVVDGLGHGFFAAEASRSAVDIFRKSQGLAPTVVLERMHAGMRSTRGAAAALVHVDTDRKSIQFSGVGNINCSLLHDGRTQALLSHNGTLGHQMRRIQQFDYSYTPGDLLIMQSDGLTTQSKQALPPSLFLESPSVIAPLIYSERLRGRDDATILVSRLG
jgi:anti-sigma regulatory factor (Ser/Thr protein kinase)